MLALHESPLWPSYGLQGPITVHAPAQLWGLSNPPELGLRVCVCVRVCWYGVGKGRGGGVREEGVGGGWILGFDAGFCLRCGVCAPLAPFLIPVP